VAEDFWLFSLLTLDIPLSGLYNLLTLKVAGLIARARAELDRDGGYPEQGSCRLPVAWSGGRFCL
jgi:hypothetical protein